MKKLTSKIQTWHCYFYFNFLFYFTSTFFITLVFRFYYSLNICTDVGHLVFVIVIHSVSLSRKEMLNIFNAGFT